MLDGKNSFYTHGINIYVYLPVVGRLIEFIEHWSFLDFRVFSVLNYSVPAFNTIWMLRLIVVDSFYNRNRIVYTSGMAEKRELFAFPSRKSLYVAWKHFGCVRKSNGLISKATLDMSRAVCRHCSKSYAFNGRNIAINNPENCRRHGWI